MIKVIEHRPHKTTELPGDIKVSSIHYDIYIDGKCTTRANETMIFFGSGDEAYSESHGKYDDHEKIVAKLQEV